MPRPAEPGVPPPIVTPPSAPTVAPTLSVPPVVPGRVPPEADAIRFGLRAIRFDGVTAYAPQVVEALARDLVGREITVAELFALADRVTALYRGDGYVLSRVVVPAQEIEDGAARIQVIEGYVARVVIEGEAGPARARIERTMAEVAALRPVRLRDIERRLLLANDLPGIRATAVLRAGAELGAAELVVTVGRTPFEGFASVNNRGSEFIGPWSAALGVTESSFTRLAERTRLLAFAPWRPKEQLYGEVDTSVQLGDAGLQLDAQASYSPSEPGSFLAEVDTRSETWRYALGTSFPLRRRRDLSVWLEGSLAWSRATSDAGDARIFEDRMDVAELGLRLEGIDPLGGDDRLRLALRQGLPLPGVSRRRDEATSRPEASGTFTAVTARASTEQPLPAPFSLFVEGAAQYARKELLSDAEIKFGGTDLLRGYPPAELTGDAGLGLHLELRASKRPGWRYAQLIQAYGFADRATVWNRDEDDSIGDRTASSVGAGIRWLPRDGVYLELELAKGLDEQQSGDDDLGKRPLKLFLTTSVVF